LALQLDLGQMGQGQPPRQVHWETLYDLAAFERKKLARLRCYLENKTLRLKQAFQLGRMWNAYTAHQQRERSNGSAPLGS
jgi:hypothetical protein